MQVPVVADNFSLGIPTRYTFSPIGSGIWREQPEDSLRIRDLGLGPATDDALCARHLAALRAGSTSDWPTANARFEFLFVYNGTATFTLENHQEVVVCKDDVVHLPFLPSVVGVSFSEDFEAFELHTPLGAKSPAEAALELPLVDAALAPLAISYESEEAYELGNGPRKFFRYRDLGTQLLTSRQIHIHIVEATGFPGTGTGWHRHTMSQLFVILRGDADISVKGCGESLIRAGDAMTIGRLTPHDVSRFSDDYRVLEICIPTDYDTIDGTN